MRSGRANEASMGLGKQVVPRFESYQMGYETHQEVAFE